jgi:pimeloyl-ACP methyl ester carboxylesterase
MLAAGVVGALIVPTSAPALGPGSNIAAGPLSDLPAGVAAAAQEAEPSLPVPASWPFPDSFSPTSGTGRLIDGAFEWTDWVYDAFGPTTGVPVNTDNLLAKGGYTYSAGPADNDGADIFRAAVGLTAGATIWRVDWNTLVNPNVPIAEWTFDTDNNAATGASEWPGNANVSSPGIEKALVVSAKKAELINAKSGSVITVLPTIVDMSARSFIVSIPLAVMPVSGQWRIRLAAGLANASGTGFAVPVGAGGVPVAATAPRVYNITFRTAAQESPTYASGVPNGVIAGAASGLKPVPVVGPDDVAGETTLLTGNFWADADQAETLAGGNVSKFSQLINWGQLAERDTTPPPVVLGWSDRWYVTDLALGQGINGSPDASPQLLGRVQPYAVYIPTTYTGSQPLPLTWILHAALTNYNIYGASDPRLIQELCQDRDSICVTPEGFGPLGFYEGIAEHDFWQVWHQVADAFKVAPNRTVLTGFSMGGLGAYDLAATYPSVFSEAMPLDGGFEESCSTLGEGLQEEVITSAPDRTANDRWVPFVISDAYADELSPYPTELLEVDRFRASSDRFTFFSTAGGEHLVTLAEDGFSTQVSALGGSPPAASDPGTINYTWCPQTVDPNLGLGPTSVYWISGLSERTTAVGTTSNVEAVDNAIPEAPVTEQVKLTVDVPPDAPPMSALSGSWLSGKVPASRQTLSLVLKNVATLTIDTVAAHLPIGTANVITDGPTIVSLTGLAAGSTLRVAGHSTLVGPSGVATVRLPRGTSSIAWTR